MGTVTVRLSDRAFAAGAPGVVAEIVTDVVPRGVLASVVIVRRTVAGKLDTIGEGEKRQVAPLGRPAGQERVTVPLNDPIGDTCKAITDESLA
jgi:hypothetical protein